MCLKEKQSWRRRQALSILEAGVLGPWRFIYKMGGCEGSIIYMKMLLKPLLYKWEGFYFIGHITYFFSSQNLT